MVRVKVLSVWHLTINHLQSGIQTGHKLQKIRLTTSGAPGTGKGADGSIWTEISFDKAYEINQVSFTPRQDSNSGQVTKASLYIQTEKNGEWVEVAKDQTFDANKSEKHLLLIHRMYMDSSL